jgi:glyoxylase-like metal-dependent hydrolase (beta-lactamase superfamily II)
MYILLSRENALIIDPHETKEVFNLLKNIKEIKIILTHEHADHISVLFGFQSNYDSTVICSAACAKYLANEKNKNPVLLSLILDQQDLENGTHVLELFKKEYTGHTYHADITFENNYSFFWCRHKIEIINLKGHTDGSCIVNLDNKIVFTGDILMKKYPVITRFPGGDTKKYKQETLPFLNSYLKKGMHIFPGHGAPFSLEKIIRDGKIAVTIN